jgi:hypothetical protein
MMTHNSETDSDSLIPMTEQAMNAASFSEHYKHAFEFESCGRRRSCRRNTLDSVFDGTALKFMQRETEAFDAFPCQAA